MTSIKNLLIRVLFGLWGLSSASPTPVVIWHGIGDTSDGLPKLIKKYLEDHIDGVYVKRLKIGYTPMDEFQNSFFMHPNTQISMACKKIQDDPNLTEGYNAIGLSQGGIFIRAVAQRCPSPPMKNLITMGSPHQGVYGLPKCPTMQIGICEVIRNYLYLAAYKRSTQRFLVPATYWHDPFNEIVYRTQSTFLSDINNERRINERYSRNLQKLEKFVMVMFRNDSVTQPRDTQWFEFYVPGQDQVILPLNESRLYLEDRLGLAQMDRNGQLVFVELNGEHLVFSEDWFRKNILLYLNS